MVAFMPGYLLCSCSPELSLELGIPVATAVRTSIDAIAYHRGGRLRSPLTSGRVEKKKKRKREAKKALLSTSHLLLQVLQAGWPTLIYPCAQRRGSMRSLGSSHTWRTLPSR